MLILVVGDAHIPHLSSEIPTKLKKLLVPGSIEQVINVGNTFDPDTRRLLERITPSKPIINVLGSLDEVSKESKTEEILTLKNLKIGVVSSFEIIPINDTDSLASKARELGVDILLYGSYFQETECWDNRYYISPGSLTGAQSAIDIANGDLRSVPGFCLLDVGEKVTVFMYKLEQDEVKVEKAELDF